MLRKVKPAEHDELVLASLAAARRRAESNPGGRYCKPSRASRTSVTASGKITAMTERSLLGLLLGRALDVGAVHRRHGQIDRELDRVVGPGQPLSALHLLGELAEPALQIVRVTEQSAEAASFHASMVAHPRPPGVGARAPPAAQAGDSAPLPFAAR